MNNNKILRTIYDNRATSCAGSCDGRRPVTRTYRRIVLLGCLTALAGVVLAQLLFGGIILAVAGLAVTAVALSSNGGAGGRQPLLWACAVAGTAWVIATGLYWWQLAQRIELARNGHPTNLADGVLLVLQGVGFASVAVIIVIAVVASLLRMRTRR